MHMLIAFVLLLNFMIAILSNTYATMLESGSFKYKCSLFEYCERYIIAFQEIDKNLGGYGELVVHPPVINVFCAFLLPFALYKPAMEKV